MMKSWLWLSVIYFSMLCAAAYGSLATGVNLLDNPGFEEATIDPWAAEGTSAVLSISSLAQTGAQSAQVDFPALDNRGIRQNLAIDAGDRLKEYTVSCSVNGDGHGQKILYKLGLWEIGPSGNTLNSSGWFSTAAGSTNWVDLSFTYTLSNTNATTLRAVVVCYPQAPKTAGHFLVDDFSLVKAVELPDDGNLLLNPGFENVTIDPWTVEGGDTAVLSISSTARTGAQSAQLDYPAADGKGVRQVLALDEESRLQEYTISCSVNSDGHDQKVLFKLGLWEFASDGQVIESSSWFSTSAGSSNWVDLTFTRTLTLTNATSLRAVVVCYPQAPKTAGHFLVDDFSLESYIPVTPFPSIDGTNLLVNGEFTQATNEVDYTAGVYPGFWTVNGSLSDWTGFWGKSADLTGWTHYHADPNIPGVATEIGTTNNPSLTADGAEFTLDGTDKFSLAFNEDDGYMTINSAGGFRNGMMQTLSGVTIDPALTYELTVDVLKNANHDHDSATFTLAMTSGTGTDATNLANVVTGGLLQIPVTNLTDSYTSRTIQLSGADLTGQLNVLVENLNTESIPGFPDVDPADVVNAENVSQVKISRVALAFLPIAGDLDKDGYITWKDAALANSYLDGSIDGGVDAVTRQNNAIANGNTPAEALALLNLTDFDINGDGTFDAADEAAIDALMPPLVVENSAMASGSFNVNVSGVTPGTIYYLKRSTNLVGGAFDFVADSVTPASGEILMSDTNPPAGQAFYKVTE